MTYSILARDPESREIGVAVATRWPAVGAVVPWLEAEVGAVVTQSFTNIELGPLGLAAMGAGAAASDALAELLAGDRESALRQVALVDGTGRTAAHTGAACVAESGHICDDGVSVQGNMLDRPDVLPRMLDAYRVTEGDLAERLLAALRAGERAGGDIRGRSSASLAVTAVAPAASVLAHRFDLRVDDAPDPLQELGRLLAVARAYEALKAAFGAGRDDDPAAALAATTSARALAPDDAHIAYWHALALASNEQLAEARALYASALEREPRLAAMGSRYARAGHGSGFERARRSLLESS